MPSYYDTYEVPSQPPPQAPKGLGGGSLLPQALIDLMSDERQRMRGGARGRRRDSTIETCARGSRDLCERKERETRQEERDSSRNREESREEGGEERRKAEESDEVSPRTRPGASMLTECGSETISRRFPLPPVPGLMREGGSQVPGGSTIPPFLSPSLSTMMSTRLSSVRAPVSAISARKHCVVRASSASQSTSVTKKSVASVAPRVALPALVGALSSFAAPALALVDDRMNGDGVGLPLGINDPALAIALASVATFVWSQYYLSQRDLGGDKGDDSGLSL